MDGKIKDEPILKVENLCRYFDGDIKAVDDVSFEIYRGEVFGLVGESGCGKTTTGRTIIKLYGATGGNVYFNGRRICAGTLFYESEIKAAKKRCRAEIASLKNLKKSDAAAYAQRVEQAKNAYSEVLRVQRENIRAANRDEKNCNKNFAAAQVECVKREFLPKLSKEQSESERKKLFKEYTAAVKAAKKSKPTNKMQMIFQDPVASLDPRMTVRDIIAEGLIIRGERDKKRVDEKVYKVLEMVGLNAGHAARYPHEFSGGQRQRIGIARTIVLNPDLIIADEPVSALDVSVQAQIINLLNGLKKSLDLTILFIAHDLSVVKYFCDRIGVMHYGKLVETASSDELFARPLHPYTKSLLSAIPLPDPEYERARRRIIYNPVAEHDYAEDKPQMREVSKGHFVYCNGAEYQKYLKAVKNDGGN